jgi:hypothetical protein
MPKEYTHWWLALETLRELRRCGGSPEGEGPGHNPAALADILQKNRNLFLLGAVGPDFLFYYLSGPEKERFRDAAMVLHGGTGGDTLAVIAGTMEHYGGVVPEPVRAFLFGYACHVAADAVFHPFVLYFVGKGSEQARFDHHLFESVLDLYVKDHIEPAGVPATLRDLAAGMEMDRKGFLDLLGFVSFGGGEYDRTALEKCLRRYEVLQSLFWNPIGKIASKAAALFSPGLRHFEPAFYQRRFNKMASAFGGTHRFRHPVTGEEVTASIADLRDRMTSESLRIAGLFGTPKEIRGPNLETGLFGDTARDIRHTAPGGIGEIFTT